MTFTRESEVYLLRGLRLRSIGRNAHSQTRRVIFPTTMRAERALFYVSDISESVGDFRVHVSCF